MSEEQLKVFLEAVKSDAVLEEKLNAASDADADADVEIAKAAGFVISSDDVKKVRSEVSDAELEAAAGGLTKTIKNPSYWCLRETYYPC